MQIEFGGLPMKKLKIYLDTTVISFLKADDSIDKMNLTLQFWELARQNKFIIVLSQLTLDEVLRCSEPKRSILFDYLKQIDFDDFDITKDVEDLGNKYIQEEIIPQKYADDAYHIAAASVYECDVIASWNFQHIVKYKTIIGVNGINKMLGYKEIEILTPESMVGEEE